VNGIELTSYFNNKTR